MNAHKGNPTYLVSVDRYAADVLREEAKKILEFNHECFEDLRFFEPRSQYALSLPFRDAFALLDAVGWARDPRTDQRAVHVPMTRGLVEQLHHRRRDLTATNLDRAEALDDTMNLEAIAALRAGITIDRLAIHALDRVFGEYARAKDA